MPDIKDYTQFTLEELLAEEKKMKKNEIYAALAIGFLIGIMVFGVAAKGFGLVYIGIPLVLIFAITRNSKAHLQNRQQLQTAIRNKTAG
jgi:4-amino-4-deoxy-L-arabinose transferase-like glycosyltransferase